MNNKKAVRVLREAIKLCPGAEWADAVETVLARVAALEKELGDSVQKSIAFREQRDAAFERIKVPKLGGQPVEAWDKRQLVTKDKSKTVDVWFPRETAPHFFGECILLPE